MAGLRGVRGRLTAISDRTLAAPARTARRRWRWVFLILFLLVMTVAVSAHLFLVRYMPLNARAAGMHSVTPSSLVIARNNAFPFENGTIDQYYLRWTPGGSIQLAFPLANQGRLPVTIVGLGDIPQDPGHPLGVRLLGTGTDPLHPSRITQRGTPFTVNPGDVVEVFLGLDMRRPVPAGTGSIVNEVTLKYRAGWVEREVTLPLPQSVYACAGKGCWG